MVELPQTPQTMVRLPNPVTVIPPGFLIRAPGRLAVAFGGSGSVQTTVAGIHPIDASFGGTGSVTADGLVQVHDTALGFGGPGGLSAVTVVFWSASATFGGDGGLVAAAEEFTGLPVSFGGDGGVQTATAGYVQALFGGSGEAASQLGIPASFGGDGGASTTLGLVGNAGATFGGPGGLDAVVSAFSPSGMDKSGDMATTSGGTGTITGWVARSGFPGTVITNDALVSNGNASVLINGRVQLTGGYGSSSGMQIRILKNGVSIATATIEFNTTVATFTNVATTLASGDTISFQYENAFGTSATISGGSAATYLYYNQA